MNKFGVMAMMVGFALSSGTMAEQTMTKDVYKAEKERIKDDYKADKARCGSLSGNAKDVLPCRSERQRGHGRSRS
jgi:hypothetical protein